MNTSPVHLMLLALLLAVVTLFCILVGAAAVCLLASTGLPTPALCYGVRWPSQAVPPSAWHC